MGRGGERRGQEEGEIVTWVPRMSRSLMTMSYSFFWRKRSVSASPMMWLSLPTCQGWRRGHTTVRWRVPWEGGVHHSEAFGSQGERCGCITSASKFLMVVSAAPTALRTRIASFLSPSLSLSAFECSMCSLTKACRAARRTGRGRRVRGEGEGGRVRGVGG